MTKVVIFGNGAIAQLAHYYFTTDSAYEVVAFTVDKDYITESTFEGKPIVSFETIEQHYPPNEYNMFIAVSYAKLNKVRAQKYTDAKTKGYKLVSYISSKCNVLTTYPIGDNCFILEDNTIQPFVKIGNNISLWSGNHIGHHSEIQDHNFISSHVVVSGHCVIESNCFIGVNSTLAHNVTIAKETLIGAGAVIAKSTEQGGVYVAPRSVKLEKKSSEFNL